jgi:hypothetical protein
MISELQWDLNSPTVSWNGEKGTVVRSYSAPIKSVCSLRDGRRVAVVEPEFQSQISNAVVFEESGEEVFRVPPAKFGSNALFGDVYYVANELTFICLYPERDVAIVVDEADGTVLREYETR